MEITLKKEYYDALLAKDPSYEGIFYVGVKTTGVFCRPTCPARKPKFEHCEFFATAKEALLASYRPCKRCNPLSNPQQLPEEIHKLIKAIEAFPEKKWKDASFIKLGVNSSRARRLFKKHFGMTFVEYARLRRIGIALKEIRKGNQVIEAQLSAGYASGSGFRDAFSKIMGMAPAKGGNLKLYRSAIIETPLGQMIAIADNKALVLLEFTDRRGLEKEIERLRKRNQAAVIPGKCSPIHSIQKELNEYFENVLKSFRTPIRTNGSPFQEKVWETLKQIPIGHTCSYLDLAKKVGNPKAVRAVANVNGANQLAIIIPCHRVINANGEIGGYGGGLARKKWLIEHEKKFNRSS